MKTSSVGSFVAMSLRRLCFAAALSAFVGALPALAQDDTRSLPHPWRISLGVSTLQRVTGSGSSLFGPGASESNAPFVTLGVSRDVSRLSSRSSASPGPVVSVYFDAATHANIFGSSVSYSGLGASLRTGGARGYGGIGFGYYRATGGDNSNSSIGGKLFAGIPFGGTDAGRGFFGQIDVTLPSTDTNAIPAFHLGYRF